MYCQNWHIDLPNTTDLSYPQRSSSCIQRLNWPQFPATIVQLDFYDSADLSFLQRSSSCILRLDRLQLPSSSCISMTRPTPATLIEHPAAHIYDSTIPAINITHLAEDPNTTAKDFTHTFVILTIKSSLLLDLLPRLCSIHCLWLSLLARIKLKSFVG